LDTRTGLVQEKRRGLILDLLGILLATLGAGIGSVWLAALLSLGLLRHCVQYTQHLLSLAAGALLATAFMHLLPEAFEGGVSPQALFATLLVGLVFFFLLDKAELWHHGHEHHHGGQGHGHSGHDDNGHAHQKFSQAHAHAHVDAHAHSHAPVHHHHSHTSKAGAWAVLVGDSVHAFGDGILIASAYMAAPSLGLIAALAVLAHEIPHHMGDLLVLSQHTQNKVKTALVKVSLAGAVTSLGGLVAYVLLSQLQGNLQAWLPYLLVVASSSFVYVALADLIPQLQTRLNLRQTMAQIAWLVAGIALVSVASLLVRGGH
jgi:zinc and cadmium transporter